MKRPETPFGAPPQSGEQADQEVSVLYLPSLEELLEIYGGLEPEDIYEVFCKNLDTKISELEEQIAEYESILKLLKKPPEALNSVINKQVFIADISEQIKECIKTIAKLKNEVAELKAYKAKVKRQLDEWLNNHPAEDSQNPNTDTTVQDLIKYHEGKSPNDIKKSVEDVIESTVESYIKFNRIRGIAADDGYIVDWKTARTAEIDAWYEQQIAKTNSEANLPFAQTAPHTIVQEFIEFFGDLSLDKIKESVEDVIESTVESYLKFNSNRGIVTDKMYIEDWKTARKAEIDAWYKRRTALEDPESDLKTIPFGGYIRRFIEKVRLRDSKSP